MREKIKKMKVEKKLRFCFTLVVIIASIAAVLGIAALVLVNSRYNKVLVQNGFSQGEIGIFSTYLNKEPAMIRELILLQDETEIKEAVGELDEIRKKTDAALDVLDAHCTTEEEKKLLATVNDTLPTYRDIFEQVQEKAQNNQNEEALDLLMSQGKPTLKILTDAVEELIDLNVQMGNEGSRNMQYLALIVLAVMVIVIVVSIVIAMRIAGFVAKLFAEPIKHVQDASAKMASGDLNIEIDSMYPDEIGDMTESFKEAASLLKQYIHELSRGLREVAAGNFDIATEVDFRGDFAELDRAIVTIITSLSDTLGNIHESTEQVSMGAYQMAESATSLAEGATNQASSVEELTASIQNITETIVNSSEKAQESHENAEQFMGEAEKSNEDIRQLKSAMDRINDTSKEIVNIITAIEDIAAQTNLLSLNASIEAARAGEAGKGFAVVADQIGKLAADSASAAVDTKRLIENSIQEVERGNEITARTTDAIESLIRGIATLAESTDEISKMTVAQADAMKQMESGVEQISEVIQNNSAAAEETSATSEELSAQTENLEQMVGKFTLKQ